MALTSAQLKQLQQALLDGFPTRAHLEMMLRFELDEQLDAVAEAEDHTLRVYKLITWAERTGHLRALIDGAVEQNGDDPRVKRLAAESHTWRVDEVANRAPPQNVSRRGDLTQAMLTAAYLDHLLVAPLLGLQGHGHGRPGCRSSCLCCKCLCRSKLASNCHRVRLGRALSKSTKPKSYRLYRGAKFGCASFFQLAGRQVTDEEASVMGERVSEPLPILDLLSQHDGLIILGDPGAGKTTVLKYLAVILAQNQGTELALADRLPVLVPLSAYANALTQQDIALQDFVGDYYRKRGIDLPVDQLLEQALSDGRALVMFDGLDEVQTMAQRSLVVERVETFCDYQRKRGNKFLITIRIVLYRGASDCPGLARVYIVDFDEDDILLFVERWTGASDRLPRRVGQRGLAAAEEKAELLFALERNPGVRQSAANPLLLTTWHW